MLEHSYRHYRKQSGVRVINSVLSYNSDWEMPVAFNSIVSIKLWANAYYSVPEGKNGKLTMTETSHIVSCYGNNRP